MGTSRQELDAQGGRAVPVSVPQTTGNLDGSSEVLLSEDDNTPPGSPTLPPPAGLHQGVRKSFSDDGEEPAGADSKTRVKESGDSFYLEDSSSTTFTEEAIQTVLNKIKAVVKSNPGDPPTVTDGSVAYLYPAESKKEYSTVRIYMANQPLNITVRREEEINQSGGPAEIDVNEFKRHLQRRLETRPLAFIGQIEQTSGSSFITSYKDGVAYYEQPEGKAGPDQQTTKVHYLNPFTNYFCTRDIEHEGEFGLEVLWKYNALEGVFGRQIGKQIAGVIDELAQVFSVTNDGIDPSISQLQQYLKQFEDAVAAEAIKTDSSNPDWLAILTPIANTINLLQQATPNDPCWPLLAKLAGALAALVFTGYFIYLAVTMSLIFLAVPAAVAVALTALVAAVYCIDPHKNRLGAEIGVAKFGLFAESEAGQNARRLVELVTTAVKQNSDAKQTFDSLTTSLGRARQ